MRIQNRCAYSRVALALACLAFALAGCGGGGGDTSGASTSPSGTSTPTIPTTTETEPAIIPSSTPTSNPTDQTGTTATLQWSAPQSMTDGSAVNGIVGYRVYYGKDVMQLSSKIDVLNPSVSTFVVEGLTPGTYYFAVSALHSSGGESSRSNAGMKVIS
jgi:hypothetical protein